MAVGDVVSEITSIAKDAYLDIQPGAGAEWVIHNIYYQDKATVEFYDGSNSIVFFSDLSAEAGMLAFHAFHVTNGHRIRICNKHAADAKLLGYDGIVTK
jgi:hypothetical protein